MPRQLLFVYGTLRPGCNNPMAIWLNSAAWHAGRATVIGKLYQVQDYPGVVPSSAGIVAGDLFLLPDDPSVLERLDAYEECSPAFPAPHEYKRERLVVEGAEGSLEAWVYVYQGDVHGLDLIESGDFLS